MSEETREPRSNAYERATMEAPVKKRQTGETLMTVGVLMLVFAWILVVFVPSDIRSGHFFWTGVVATDVVIALVLMGIGYLSREQVKSRLNV